MEEEDMVRLQPITVEQARAKGQGGQKFNQDTSNPDGFIGKLTKQDETKFRQAGIMTPEEAAGTYLLTHPMICLITHSTILITRSAVRSIERNIRHHFTTAGNIPS